MRPSSKRMFSLLLGGVLLVAALALYGAFIKPEYEIINELRGTAAAERRLLREQEQVISSVQNLLAQYQGAARLEEAVSLALPEGEETAAVFNQINALARANNLFLSSFNLQALVSRPPLTPSAVVKDIGVLQATLRLSGPYPNFKKFLEGVETNIRLMDLQSLKMESGNYTLVVNTYYQIP